MGGENAGDVASKIAVREISSYVMKSCMKPEAASSLKTVLMAAVAAANSAVYDKACSSPELSGMGTTAVAAIVRSERLIIAHAGDSRAYMINSDGIRQITKDHSFVRQLVEQGLISEDEAETHPQKNLITRALGVQSFIDVELSEETLGEGYTILLCSDGLTNFVSDEEILAVINSNPIEETAKILVDTANSNGGGDNITAVVFSDR